VLIPFATSVALSTSSAGMRTIILISLVSSALASREGRSTHVVWQVHDEIHICVAKGVVERFQFSA
jgi:hypothetical protein